MPHVLFVGADPLDLQSVVPDADVSGVADVAAAVERCRRSPGVDLVVGDEAALRAALDPLGLGAGPAVAAPGSAREVALELAAAVSRARARDAERALAVQAVEHGVAAEAAEAELLTRLERAAAFSDDNTEEHNARVGDTAARLAAALGAETSFVAALRSAARLHDLGKIAVPDAILLKPGRLSPEEFAVVRTHAAIGARILGGTSRSPVVSLAAQVARSHHERWDGGGYPDGLAGDAIPLAGRIVAVADVYDILTHERPWKEEWSPAQAREELGRAAGTQFDPAVVQAFSTL